MEGFDNLDPKYYKKILTASAPGKVILTGEHAVVYGVTAISTAINKRTFVSIYEPIDIHRVIPLQNKSTSNSSSNPCNSKLILKLDHVELNWKSSDLIAIHILNGTSILFRGFKKSQVLNQRVNFENRVSQVLNL